MTPHTGHAKCWLKIVPFSLSLSVVARKEEKPKKENVSLFAPNQAPKKAVRVAALSGL